MEGGDGRVGRDLNSGWNRLRRTTDGSPTISRAPLLERPGNDEAGLISCARKWLLTS
jgi:hypothetical protein